MHNVFTSMILIFYSINRERGFHNLSLLRAPFNVVFLVFRDLVGRYPSSYFISYSIRILYIAYMWFIGVHVFYFFYVIYMYRCIVLYTLYSSTENPKLFFSYYILELSRGLYWVI